MARRGRELEPAWAEGLSLDEIESEREARALPIDTDPDTVGDPDVRERFLARLNRDEHEPGPRRTAHRPNPRSPRKGGAKRAPARSRRRFSHPAHAGTGARGQVVGRPTLRPPSSMSTRDWTGFGFGLLLYALAASYLRYGPGGPTLWLKAKFVNKTAGGPSATLPPSSTALPPRQLHNRGLTPPGSTGRKNPPLTGPGSDQMWIQGKDGLWYPATPKVGQLPVRP